MTNSVASLLASKGLDRHDGLWRQRIDAVTAADVEAALATPPGIYSLEKMAVMVSPAARNYIEDMAQAAHELTVQRFGRTVRLYVPLYLSSFCVNRCLYCGFNLDTDVQRARLTVEQAIAEADILAGAGFRDLLLVSSEDRDFITVDYLCALAEALRDRFSSISVEIYQLSTAQYAGLFSAGIEGVTIYQETYDRTLYNRYHAGGPKADYDNRLRTPDDIGTAGMREIGIGSLLGLGHWRAEALAMAEHAHWLMKRYWRARVSVSFPRMRPADGVGPGQFEHLPGDTEFVQMLTAFRLCFADVGLVISTREPASLRDHLVELGVTRISASSRTSPGAYGGYCVSAAGQFDVDDTRSAAEVAAMLKARGYDPVWKDWSRP